MPLKNGYTPYYRERKYFYGKREATLYLFDSGVRVIGFADKDQFDLRVLTIGLNPKGQGLGEEALKALRPKFKYIVVNEIMEESLPFWVKMRERGYIDCIGTVKYEYGHSYQNEAQ